MYVNSKKCGRSRWIVGEVVVVALLVPSVVLGICSKSVHIFESSIFFAFIDSFDLYIH